MRVRLTEIRLRPTGKKVRLDREVDVESLFVGRGPDNDLSLKGLTISLHHATIRKSDGRIYVEAAAGQEVNINGLVTSGERLGIGDRLRIGSWEVRILDPDTNFDLALEYEEIDRADSERSALDARTKLGLEVGIFARRPLSWLAIAFVFGAFLLVPLVFRPAQLHWTTGSVSSGHAYIESDCQECHSGLFRSVQNSECVTCHYDIGRHVAADLGVAELENASCASCHLEHRGRAASLADSGSNFCSDCHADVSRVFAETALRSVTDFGTDHPPFELAVVTDPLAAPVRTLMTPDLVENSGLDFDHFLHVGDTLTGLDDVERFLNCGDCHQPEAGGRSMMPVVFEEHCQDCHALKFDLELPAEFAPHVDSGEIRAYLREFYWNQSLRGAVEDESAPAALRQRRPGASRNSAESAMIRDWVETKLAQTESRFYGRSGTCRTCHIALPGLASDGGMGVQAVQIQTVWAPRIVFSHDSHVPFPCARCHPAAAVFEPDSELPRPEWSLAGSIPYGLLSSDETASISESSGDILIPSIETCRECHAGANAKGRGVVPSPCSMCHPFHAREHGPMH